MHIYAVIAPNLPVEYRGTMQGAHTRAKEFAASRDWRDIRVELRDYPVDKAGVLAILNNGETFDVVTRFGFASQRLGLEVLQGEEE